MFERFSLNTFKIFYYVALYNSVTIAAEKLFVTQGAVSRQLKSLEDSLNVILFYRKGKKLELTNDGIFLFNYCQNIFHQIDECIIKISNKKNQNKNLIISCEPTICMKWLIPRLNKFNSLNHGFGIDLITSGSEVDFSLQTFDLALRRNHAMWGEHIFSKKISDEIIFFVRNADSGNTSKVLLSKSRPKFWNHLLNINSIKDQIIGLNYEELDYFYLCIEGCLAGLGSTLVSGYMIERELKNDFLISLSKPFLDGSSYYLLSSQPFEDDYRKMIFKEWLKTEMQEAKGELLKK
ncbi:LysR family transcriptional regulator [Acinetobacter nematophilus]|uniref:LysR family transcriptional regulator n=1 Tax=Acinetobacter nematophilus TaxID=2994642 RepID=A0A9X3E412_9GAMM|nr:LysR family transcriptional regulator [Acinetobacter nematophilus]MCX5469019.1 LysR family transcriptional regulator [Acinetobacter nematophilus]